MSSWKENLDKNLTLKWLYIYLLCWTCSPLVPMLPTVTINSTTSTISGIVICEAMVTIPHDF